MRAVVQRVKAAWVTVDGAEVGRIGPGLMVLLGVKKGDTQRDAQWLADKICGLRIFPDEDYKLNLSLLESGGEILVVSQFTLWGDCTRGRRPGFSRAADGDEARPLYEYFVELLRAKGLAAPTGRFGAEMEVSLVNHGPVTILVDSEKTF